MLNWINLIQVSCFYFSRLTWKPDVLLEWRTLCLRDWSLVWRFYGLEAMLFTIKWEWIETNASNQMIFPPILKIHGTFIKGFEDIIDNWDERRTSVSIIYLISHIFFIHRLLNFENFLQVWKMLEFPISIHSLWSWEVSLILNVNLFRFWIFISSLDKMVWNDRHMERNIMYWRE